MKKNNRKIKDLGYIKQNGILINGDILLSSEREFSPKYYLLFQIFLAFAAVMCTITITASFINNGSQDSENGFHINGGILLFYSAITTLVFGLLKCRQKAVKIGAAVFSAIHIIYLAANYSNIKTGFFAAADRYLSRANQPNSIWGGYLKNIPSAEYSYYASVFFIALITVIALAVTAACVYRIDFPLLFIATFPFFELGIYWGWEPPALSVIGLTICWITVLALHIINHTTNRAGKNNTFAVHERKKTFYFTSENQKAKFYIIYIKFVCVLSALVFLLIVVFSNITGFTRPESFNKYRKEISNAAANFSLSDLGNAFSDYDGGLDLFGVKTVGGTNGGILGTTSSISFNGSTALNIKTNAFNYVMYLKGYVGGVYKDNRWIPFEINKNDVLFDDYFTNANLWVQDMNYSILQDKFEQSNLEPETIEITVKGASKKFAYAPYGALYTSDINNSGMKPTIDSYVKLGSVGYSMYYYNLSEMGYNWTEFQNTIVNQSGTGSIQEKKAIDEYRNFVYQNYLDAYNSQALTNAYQDIVNFYLTGTSENWSFNEIYTAIKTYFADNFKYTLEPGITPEGEDFIDYFLTVQKEGYCSYFATTGTELLRMFGYPARYVEGYMVLPSQLGNLNGDKYEIDVKDRSAHAWAEVYIDGAGWLPAEFTPGYENNNPNLTESEKNPPVTTTAETSGAESDNKSSVAAQSSSAKESSVSTETNVKDNENADNSITKADKSVGVSSLPETAKNDDNNASKLMSGIFISIVGILAAAAGLVIRRKIKLNEMRDKCKRRNTNECVSWIFRYTLKYLDLIGINNNLNITDMQLCEILKEKCVKLNIDGLNEKLSVLCALAVKSHMSSNEITHEEAVEAYKIMKFTANKVVLPKLTTAGKLTAKYIYCLY